jgi:hypothetical protein
MKHRKTATRALAALATIAGTAAFAGAAQAAVIGDNAVRLTSTGFDLGGPGFLLGEPVGNGSLVWTYGNGQVTAHLTGTLHLNGVDGHCARIRMEYFDDDGAAVTTRYGGTVCAADNGHHAWSVDQSYTDARTKSVKVSIQDEDAIGWSTATWGSWYAVPPTDAVKLTESGADFGSYDFLLGEPTGNGFLSWNLSDGQVTPRLTGTLHLNNVASQCARMHMRYLTEAGTYITGKYGGVVCAPGNGHYRWSVDLDDYTGVVGQVEVELQTQDTLGQWWIRDSQTVSVSA